MITQYVITWWSDGSHTNCPGGVMTDINFHNSYTNSATINKSVPVLYYKHVLENSKQAVEKIKAADSLNLVLE